MFKKLQLKLIFIYTIVLIVILLTSNIIIYFVLSSYNSNQLADDVEQILYEINSTEWIKEYYDDNIKPQEIEDEDSLGESDDNDEPEETEDPEESEIPNLKEETDSPEKSESPDSEEETDSPEESESPDSEEDTDSPEETETPEESEEPENPEETETPEESEEPENPEETETPEESEEPESPEESKYITESLIFVSSEKSILSMVINVQETPVESAVQKEPEENSLKFSDDTDLFIPNVLNSFSYYFIYSNSGELLKWKSSDNRLLNQMYSISQNLEINQPPELIDLSNQNDGTYLVIKRPIIVDGYQLGYYTIGENVSAAYDTLDNLKLIMILVTIAGSFLSLGIGYIFAGKVIKPIKEAYKAKEKFIGDASHELRNPLSIILLSIESLKRKNKGQNHQTENLIDDVRIEALNMKDLVDKLLFIARNDSKSIKLQYENIDLSQVINDNIEKYKRLSSNKQLSYKENVPEKLMIQGDPKMIDSVVSVLIDNAVKYNKICGEIFVGAEIVNKDKKEYVKLTIRDTGIGIKETDLDKVFERFHRQDKSRSKMIPGYGLGLPIAKEIVELHHGSIEIQSYESIGTTFTVMLLKTI